VVEPRVAGLDGHYPLRRISRAHARRARVAPLIQPNDQPGGRRGRQFVLDCLDDEALVVEAFRSGESVHGIIPSNRRDG
jgi:hypothetical protein